MCYLEIHSIHEKSIIKIYSLYNKNVSIKNCCASETGNRDFAVQDMDIRNGKTWDVSGTQYYVVLSL